ncbi:MAG: hypothetical protein ABJD97_12260 [Betaproteobacteria bacterium]
MNQTTPTRHPWKALAAVVCMAAAVHGVQASTGDDERDVPAHVHVIGHMPLHDACPDVDDELSDALVPAWNDADTPVTVPVEFKVQGSNVFDVVPASSSPRLERQVRRAVRGLQCDSHDDQVHTVALVVRFVGRDGGRVATMTQVAIDDRADD